jgi:hypothetical protein
MNIIYPILLGIIAKLYDDIIDMNMNVSPLVMETLKSVLILFFVLTSLNDFYFSFACFIIAIFNSGFDNPFWKSIIVVCGIVTIINLPYAGHNIFLKICLTILVIICILFIAYIEEKKFPEEISSKKIFSRIILVIVFGIIAFAPLMERLPIPYFGKEPLRKAVLILFSNLIVSVIIMSYLLYFSDKTPSDSKG